ncbi:hypothetical protein Tco_0492163 [Tanacetum coccineum]
MDTLSLVSEYLKDLEECMDDGDSKVAKEAKLFDALEHKSVVIEVDIQKIAIFTKAPLRAFGEPFMRKMVNDVNMEIHRVKFKADFVVLDYVNEGEPSIMFGRDFLVTTQSQVNFGLGEIRMNLTKFKEDIEVIDLTEEVGSSSEEVIKMGKANCNKGYNINKLTPLPSLKVLDIKYNELEESKPILEVLENYVVYKKKLDEILIGTLCIDDRVIRHTYFPKPRSKLHVEAFEMEGEDDWLGSFEVGRDEDGNVKEDDRAPCRATNMLCRAAREVLSPFLPNLNGHVQGVGMIKLEYIYEGDGDVFVDYSSERALSIDNEIYPEWVLEFFSTLYFDKDADRTNLMKEKCLFTEEEVEHRLFVVYFGKLEVDEVGKPTLTNHKDVLVKEPLMQIMHKVIVGSLVHRVASGERCQKQDLWMMSALEESRGVNFAWIIVDHLYKHASGTKENSVICAGHYMLANELDKENTCLKKETGILTQAAEGSSGPRQEHGDYPNSGNQSNQGGSYRLGDDDYFTSAMPDFGGSSSGYAVGGSFREVGFNDDDMDK